MGSREEGGDAHCAGEGVDACRHVGGGGVEEAGGDARGVEEEVDRRVQEPWDWGEEPEWRRGEEER